MARAPLDVNAETRMHPGLSPALCRRKAHGPLCVHVPRQPFVVLKSSRKLSNLLEEVVPLISALASWHAGLHQPRCTVAAGASLLGDASRQLLVLRQAPRCEAIAQERGAEELPLVGLGEQRRTRTKRERRT